MIFETTITKNQSARRRNGRTQSATTTFFKKLATVSEIRKINPGYQIIFSILLTKTSDEAVDTGMAVYSPSFLMKDIRHINFRIFFYDTVTEEKET